jgi:hypothetical protein
MLMFVDLAKASQCLIRAELPRAGHERPESLAATAEPEPGVEELATDPVVVAYGVRQLLHIRAGASQSSAIALMNEVFVARNEFAGLFTISAVA